jgi:hypothetical protein
MNWSLGASPLIVGVGLLIWAGAGYISYLNWQRSGKRKAVRRLETLRFVLITFLAFTLLRPELVQIVRSKEQPEVAILVDRSGSMATRDVIATNLLRREEWVNQQLEKKFWSPLARKTKVVVEEFGMQRATTNAGPRQVEGTDLNSALEAALSREHNLKSVLLLTDGDWNVGKSPIAAATEYRDRDIPIFTLGVGTET